jgi:transcriptional regulator with XRE-family HTH domain
VSDKSEREVALMKLGDAIRARRHELKMSQEALADAAKIGRTHMGEVERGSRNVSFMALVRIAKAMKVAPSEIITAAGL